jgi:peptidoglycan/LPS O-acetylase OafA/YrhL
LAVWLVVVPALLVGATVAIGALGLLTTTRAEVALIAGYFAWAFIGGLIVHPSGRWREVILIAAALVVFLLVVDFVAYTAAVLTHNDQPGDDNGVGVGMMFLVVVVFPPTLIPVALGKVVRRTFARSAATD